MKKLFVSASTIGFLGLLVFLWAQNVSASSTFTDLTQDKFIEFSKQPDTVVVDVRTAREYRKGHVPGAINMPHRDILSDEIDFSEFSDKNLVFYCHSGVRVGFVSKYFNENPSLSQARLFHLQGDFRAWQARGHTIEKP